jgi:hypothetical protein
MARTPGPEARGGIHQFSLTDRLCTKRHKLAENGLSPPIDVITPFLQLSRTFCEQTHRFGVPLSSEFPFDGWTARLHGVSEAN